MTRDELFDEFSRFLNARGDATRTSTPPSADVADAAASEPDLDEEAEGTVVADRAQPAKVHSKAKPKKRR
jgi:hypothetical protein